MKSIIECLIDIIECLTDFIRKYKFLILVLILFVMNLSILGYISDLSNKYDVLNDLNTSLQYSNQLLEEDVNKLNDRLDKMQTEIDN